MSFCIFCEIIAGRAEASRVYEDEVCLAFMDIRPVNPGHLLVTPKVHAAGLDDLPPETGAHLFKVGQRLSQAVRGSGVKCDGVNLLLADGEAAGQEVFHVHLHVLPRFRGDGFGFKFGALARIPPQRTELEKIAGQIKQSLER